MNARTATTPANIVHKNIAAALAAAQADMGPAMKLANNPHFKSKYADLSAVTEACLPALNAHGIAVIQPPYDDETGRYVKTILIHGESGEMLECRVPLIIGKDDMPGYGSAVTYARRYGLMSMACIAPEDDDGNAAALAAPKPGEVKAQKAAARPDEEFEADVHQALKDISRETTLEGLGAFWSDFAKRMKAVAVDARVIAAKDKRKADLQLADSADNRNADLGMDKVPF